MIEAPDEAREGSAGSAGASVAMRVGAWAHGSAMLRDTVRLLAPEQVVAR